MRRHEHFRRLGRGALGEPVLPSARRRFISPIISALAPDVASTAIAQVAAPALTGALVGAGTGALTHGNIGEDALIGGLGGGVLGYAESGPNDPLTGALGNMFGGGGTGLPAGTQTMLDANGNQIYTTANGTPLTAGQTFAAQGDYGPFSAANPSGTATMPASPTGQASSVAGAGGGLFGGKPGGISNTALALGALSAAGSLFNKPQVGTWATPGPSSTAANQGPYYNQPLQTAPGSQPIAPAANTNWYTYGQRPQTSFFTGGNSLQNYGWAKGGALGHAVSTDNGDHYVRGPGGPTGDKIPAMLSDHEYILTAADTARAGGGDPEEGARRLDRWRTELAHSYGEKKFVRQPLKGALGRRAVHVRRAA